MSEDPFPSLSAAAAPVSKKAAKKKAQKVDLNTFLASTAVGGSAPTNWADDEVELPTGPRIRSEGESVGLSGAKRYGDRPGGFERSGFPPRADVPLPTAPPYTAFCGNLSFDANEGDLTDFFGGHDAVTSVRIVKDPMDQRPKGFGYVEFTSVDALKAALELSDTEYQGRRIRVNIAEGKTDRGGRSGGFGDGFGERRSGFNDAGDEGRSMGSWDRKGPLPDLASSRGPPRAGFGDREAPARGGFGAGFGAGPDSGEPKEWGAARGSKFVPSAAPPERGRFSRTSSGTSTPLTPRDGSDDGVSRGETASTWRRATPEVQSTPPSPSTPTTPASRRPLQLAPRSVSAATEAPAGESSSKASPFGAAKPVDTAAKEAELLSKKTEPKSRSVSTASQRSESGGGRPRVDPFGAAKPVDTAAKEKEITEKLEKSKLISPATTSSPTPAASATLEPAAEETPAANKPAGTKVPAPPANAWGRKSTSANGDEAEAKDAAPVEAAAPQEEAKTTPDAAKPTETTAETTDA